MPGNRSILNRWAWATARDQPSALAGLVTSLSAHVPSYTPYGSGPVIGPEETSFAPPATPVAAEEAEAVLAALPGVISAHVVASRQGGVSEVHVLTGADVTPRQTVREVEDALLTRFGIRVEQRRISVATTTGPARRLPNVGTREPSEEQSLPRVTVAPATELPVSNGRRLADARRLYFEDVEARRSARGGLSCRVVLRRGDATATDVDLLVEGEAESGGAIRAQADEVAARAALDALTRGEGSAATFSLEGSTRVSAFGREFVLVGVVVRQGRGATLLTGSAEVRDGGTETAAVLAILDATNRWVARLGDARPRTAMA